MFDVRQYLAVLGYEGSALPTLETLRALHRRHLQVVPFDNALNAQRGSGIWNVADVDIDLVFKEVVEGGRGGVCYELNGLFRRLLRELGYEVSVLSAGVRQVDGSFGPDLEHMFNRVDLDGEPWIVDVGFAGPSILEPLRLADEVQHQDGCDYRVADEGGYRFLRRRPGSGEWADVYRFRPQARELAEWNRPDEEMARFAATTLADYPSVRSRAGERGQRILIGRRLLEVDGGEERMRVLVKKDDLEQAVRWILHRAGGASSEGGESSRGGSAT